MLWLTCVICPVDEQILMDRQLRSAAGLGPTPFRKGPKILLKHNILHLGAHKERLPRSMAQRIRGLGLSNIDARPQAVITREPSRMFSYFRLSVPRLSAGFVSQHACRLSARVRPSRRVVTASHWPRSGHASASGGPKIGRAHV